MSHRTIRAVVTFLAVVSALAVVAWAQTNVANPASDLNGQWVVTRAQNQTITGTYTWSVPAKFATGSAGSPGIVSADTTTGWALGAGSIGGSITGTQRFLLNASGLTVFGTQVINSAGTFVPTTHGFTCGRITLTTALPYTTSDVTAATTVYYTPIPACNALTVWDGTNSNLKTDTLTETTLAVPATTSTMYDLFAFDNAGSINIEALAWTNDTTRATALTLQNGFLCKALFPTRRYIGSFRTTAVSGQTEDSFAKRYLWNYYNRVERPMQVLEATANWSYGTSTFRQANAAAANQIDFVIGVSEAPVNASIAQMMTSAGLVSAAVAIGLDSTTVAASNQLNQNINVNAATVMISAQYRGFPGVGRHVLVWLEQATGATTFYGNGGGASQKAGILGSLIG